MTESKKVWVEPELIVRVRSNPEEVVLGACKFATGSGTPDGNDGNCISDGCVTCSDLAPS